MDKPHIDSITAPCLSETAAPSKSVSTNKWFTTEKSAEIWLAKNRKYLDRRNPAGYDWQVVNVEGSWGVRGKLKAHT